MLRAQLGSFKKITFMWRPEYHDPKVFVKIVEPYDNPSREIDFEYIKEIRQKTGLGMAIIKQALLEIRKKISKKI